MVSEYQTKKSGSQMIRLCDYHFYVAVLPFLFSTFWYFDQYSDESGIRVSCIEVVTVLLYVEKCSNKVHINVANFYYIFIKHRNMWKCLLPPETTNNMIWFDVLFNLLSHLNHFYNELNNRNSVMNCQINCCIC